MAKRPTPKKRHPKASGRRRHSIFVSAEVKRLKAFSASPFAGLAPKKDRGEKALKKITRVKA